eukprot:gene2452-2788_t
MTTKRSTTAQRQRGTTKKAKSAIVQQAQPATQVVNKAQPQDAPQEDHRTWESTITHLREVKRRSMTHLDAHRRTDGDESDRVELEPYTIAENVTLEEFLSRHEHNLLGDLKNRLAYVDGSVLIYELSISKAHSVLAGWFSRSWAHAGTAIGPYLQGTDDFDLTLAPGTPAQQADRSFTPFGRAGFAANADGDTFPTMIIEVGVTQSLKSLHDKAQRYLLATTDIQIVLCISLWPRRPNNSFQMVALLYIRDPLQVHSTRLPQTVVSFGTAPLHYTSRDAIRGYFQDEWRARRPIPGFVPPAAPAPLPAFPAGFVYPIHGHLNAATVPPGNPPNPVYTLNIPTASLFNGVPGVVINAAAGQVTLPAIPALGLPVLNVGNTISLNLLTLRNTLRTWKEFQFGDLPPSLVKLRFGKLYNLPLFVNAIPRLETLIFGHCYNQEIQPNTLPPSIKHIIFGFLYDQPLQPGILPQYLSSVSFESNEFNQPILPGALPPTLEDSSILYQIQSTIIP